MIAASATPRATAGIISPRSPLSPVIGSQPSVTAKSWISIRPSQKAGMETPSIAVVVATTSHALPCLMAAKTPSGTPMTMATSMAASVSWIVAPILELISRATGCAPKSERPRLPWASWAR